MISLPVDNGLLLPFMTCSGITSSRLLSVVLDERPTTGSKAVSSQVVFVFNYYVVLTAERHANIFIEAALDYYRKKLINLGL